MFEPRSAKYQWGQPVSSVADLYNDGSFPEADEDALLVAAGTVGEVVQVGRHEEANLPVYIVEFRSEPPRVLGVLEEEIAPVAGAV